MAVPGINPDNAARVNLERMRQVMKEKVSQAIDGALPGVTKVAQIAAEGVIEVGALVTATALKGAATVAGFGSLNPVIDRSVTAAKEQSLQATPAGVERSISATGAAAKTVTHTLIDGSFGAYKAGERSVEWIKGANRS